MITILAEKPDVGNKIAAALDKITLASGKVVTFSTLKANEKEVKSQQSKDGYLKIKFDGQDCYVTWGYGHLCELKQAKDYNSTYANWRRMPMPFIPAAYELTLNQLPSDKDRFGFNKKIRDQFARVKKLFNASTYIINATDFDREGEVIFAYIYELAACTKPVKRVCFASQTQTGILDAFKNLKDRSEMRNVEAAGRMRSIADWVVGANLTTAMTLQQPNGKEVLSIGRVQTPTLKILVDRELEIRAFKPQKYWTLDAEFTKGVSVYPATHTAKRFNSLAEVNAVLARVTGKPGTVTSVTEKKVTKDPPQLYSLSALQMDANARFGMTLKQTLEAAQALYDNGYTTYPRTDSRYLTEDMVPTVNKVLDALAAMPVYTPLISGRKRIFDKKRYFDDKKVESHFAIIPTGTEPRGLTSYQQRVYDLICRSVICMLYGPATVKNTTVITTVNGEAFTSSGSVIIDPGYMTVTGNSRETILPALKKGDAVSGTYEVKEKETEPPKHYSDKSLLAAMISAGKDLEDEELKKILADPSVAGIGTPATRDAIIETLISRGYVERDKKSLLATDKGIGLIKVLPVEEIKSPEITARWEKRLHEIERGNESADDFRRDIEKTMRVWCDQIRRADVAAEMSAITSPTGELKIMCPVCGKPMRKMTWGYGCSGYSAGCRFSVGTICGKKLTETQLNRLIENRDSGEIKGFTSKAGKRFDAHLVLDESNAVKFSFAK